MAIWYEVEKSEYGIRQFMECNWDFHDFSIAGVSSYPGEIDLFLKYDSLKGSVLLRFLNVLDFQIVPPEDDSSSVLGGATLILKDNKLVWLADDSYTADQIKEVQKYATWIEADQIIWAVTDADGNPAEMPDSRIKQTWHVNGNPIERKFDLKPYQKDPDVTV